MTLQFDGLKLNQAQASGKSRDALMEHEGVKQARFNDETSRKWYGSFYDQRTFRVHILGLGDVGGSLATALRTLNPDCLSAIGLYDLNPKSIQRYEHELNQIHGYQHKNVPVIALKEKDLFACDVLLFTASVGVPEVGSKVEDVRMVQFKQNAHLIERVALKAKAANFEGVFGVVSDPVDLLCRVVQEVTQWPPVRIKGFGLGVMHARARYYAAQAPDLYDLTKVSVFGPHGRDLVVFNAMDHTFDEDLSLTLKEKVVTANLAVRDLGYKPYIAPAISSAAFPLIAWLSGEWHHATVPFGTVYLGTYQQWQEDGIEMEHLPQDDKMVGWLEATMTQLGVLYASRDTE